MSSDCHANKNENKNESRNESNNESSDRKEFKILPNSYGSIFVIEASIKGASF